MSVSSGCLILKSWHTAWTDSAGFAGWRKGAKKLASVQDYAALKDDEKARHNISMSVLGAIIHAATPKNMDRLTTQCVNVGKSGLPVAETLKMLAR